MNALLPALIAVISVLLIVFGFATGGPDAVGGVVMGGIALAAAAVMHQRRTRHRL